MITLIHRIYLIVIWVIFNVSCVGNVKTPTPKKNATSSSIVRASPEAITPSSPQIAEYIRHIFQDKNGNFWLGTGKYGVAYYNQDSLTYFSNEQGFDGQQINGISEDPDHNIWFATEQGVVKYNWNHNSGEEKTFTNFSDHTYFSGQRFWSIHADSKGIIWAGSATGIYRYDGKKWLPFELPYPEESTGNFITKRTSWSITEDRQGNIWFSTNGFGAYKYDGQSFSQYALLDGFSDNSIDIILEDKIGNMWFGSRFGGARKYNGISYTHFTQENNSIGNNEVCAILEDHDGNIWLSSEGFGVYQYDGIRFTNYGQSEGLGVRAVQTIYEDRDERLWVGGGGGLYRYMGGVFVNVTKNGPWK